FCALDPSLRSQYVNKMSALLAPGGKLVGVLFNRAFEGGPPFGGSKEEYEQLFAKTFSRRSMEPCYNSIPPRRDAELFIRMEK
ncbi:MAG: TPMT family class I SAM-dependent methyltransferase, partial [Flavihumibacter sp.]|nr:TPMT family class I SAM-dependent methyltransferase [Flavihumibacter sp.]